MQCRRRVLLQGGVRAEDRDEGLRRREDQDPDDERVGEAERGHDKDGAPHVGILLCAVVVAQDGRGPLGDRVHRRVEDLAHGGDDRHDGDVERAAVLHQHVVAEDGDQGVRELHDERGGPEADDVHGVREILFSFCGAERGRIDGLLPEEPQHEQHREKLREDRRQGRAADAHAEHEDEDRIQEDVGDGADNDRDHAKAREALRVDVRIHARRDHGEDRAEEVDPEIRDGVDERGFVRAEQDEERAREDLPRDHEDDARQDFEAVGRIQDLGGFALVFAPALHGEERRAAAAVQVRERRNDDDQRECETNAGQGCRALAGNAPDVDAVHDAVEQVQDLGDQHGKCGF